MIRGLVFDVDDTLYWERDYVRGGFAHVARTFGTSDEDIRILSSWLWGAFQSGTRGDTFDRLLEAFPELAARTTVADLVETYRTHRPEIDLVPGMADALREMTAAGLRLGVLSDGPPESQAAKVAALGLDRWFDPIVLTGELGAGYAKPATAGFQLIAGAWDEDGPNLGYVADNPEKDFAGPRRLGWFTIRMRHPNQLRFQLEPRSDDFRADAELSTPLELTAVVRTARSRAPE